MIYSLWEALILKDIPLPIPPIRFVICNGFFELIISVNLGVPRETNVY